MIVSLVKVSSSPVVPTQDICGWSHQYMVKQTHLHSMPRKKKERKSGDEQVVLVKRSRIIEENFMVVIVAAEIYTSHHTC